MESHRTTFKDDFSLLAGMLALKLFCAVLCLVLSNSSCPHGLQPARLLCPWCSPGKNTAMGSHSLPQGIFPTQGLSPGPLQCRILSDRAAREALKKKYSLTSINSLVPFPQVSSHPCFSISGRNIGSNYKTQMLTALYFF